MNKKLRNYSKFQDRMQRRHNKKSECLPINCKNKEEKVKWTNKEQ